MQKTQSEVISVLIACDQEQKLRKLRSSIANLSNMQIVGEATNSPTTVKITTAKNPKVVVISSTNQEFDGLITAQLIKSRSQSKVLLIGKNLSDDEVIKAFTIGVDGYCRHYSDIESLSDAIRSVAKGNLWIDDEVAQKVVKIFKETDPKVTSKHKRLNKKEYQIFKKMAEGENLEAIVSHLNLSSEGALDQICRVLQKLSLGEDVNWLFRNANDPKKKL